jgi:SAM-dependent methyltransferase
LVDHNVSFPADTPDPGQARTAAVALAESVADRTYYNNGNPALLDLLETNCKFILDVGCGSGDNARLLKERRPQSIVFGITLSQTELEAASQDLEAGWVADIETSDLAFLGSRTFDAIIFSHVLEHLREPPKILERFLRFLKPEGFLLIAVPNVLVWSQRLKFMAGQFEYLNGGVLDDTHLRFFTYLTADQYLVSNLAGLRITRKSVSGSVPLWLLRRHVFPQRLSAWLDRIGCKVYPNLFGDQVLIQARKRS